MSAPAKQDEERGVSLCDICGEPTATMKLTELYEKFRTADVKDVCPACYADILSVEHRARVVCGELIGELTRRGIVRLHRVRFPRAA